MLAPGPLDAAAAGLLASAPVVGYLVGALLAPAGASSRSVLRQMTAAFGAGQSVGLALAGLQHGWAGRFAPGSLLAAAAPLAAAAILRNPRAAR